MTLGYWMFLFPLLPFDAERLLGIPNTSNSLTVVSIFHAKDKAFPPPTDLFKYDKSIESPGL